MSSSSMASTAIPVPSRRAARHRRTYLWLTGVGDALMIAAALALAYYLRFELGIGVSTARAPWTYYARIAALVLPTWLLILYFMGAYDYRRMLGGIDEYKRIFNACTTGMMALILFGFFGERVIISRAWLLYSWVLSVGLVSLWRFGMRRIAYSLRRRGAFTARAVIVGTNEEAAALAGQLGNQAWSGLELVGLIDPHAYTAPDPVRKAKPGVAVLGGTDRLVEIVQQREVEEVIIATTALHREQLLELFQTLAPMKGVQMRLSSGLYEIMTTGVQVSNVAGVPLLEVNSLRLEPLELALKTALDYTIILLTAVFWLPLFAVLALAVKLDSPGPIFYRRRVLGVGGKAFDAFKFRTMAVNGDELLAARPDLQAELAASHKLRVDPRVTRVGRLLRKTSLDELPQIINVLLRQMSLVGPRMITAAEAKEYGQLQMNLLTVRPGLTGLWQVSGRSDLTYAQRVRLDMQYIRNYSIWVDLQILFVQTLPAVLRQRGAY